MQGVIIDDVFGKGVSIYELIMKSLKELDFLEFVRNNKEMFMKFFMFNENEKITFNDSELIVNGSTTQLFQKFVMEETQETLLALCSFATAKRERFFLKKIKVEFTDLSGEEIHSAVCEGKLVMPTSAESYELFKFNLLNVINADGQAAFNTV